jgi:guanine nucleotide-binding protein G(i) subunit alpha
MGGKSSSMSPEDKRKHEDNVRRQKPANDKIEKLVAHRKEEEAANSKLLILGAGESGKSTLFKQWKAIYGEGFTDEEKKTCAGICQKNAIESMQTLLENSKRLGLEVDPSLAASESAVLEAKEMAPLTPALATHITRLWEDPAMKETFRQRALFQILDSSEYLFGRVNEYAKPNFVPSEEDCLRCRVRTTGIVEERFHVDNNTITVLDVGGQRTERKKWIHCFEGVTCCMFVAAISEYDQKLFEDEKVNRMEEALNLFEEVLNMKWFKDTSMILFMNKVDLFERKFKDVPLKDHMPDFNGTTAEDGKKFMQAQFLARDKSKERDIYCYFTTATDKDNIQNVLKAVKDVVLRRYLEGGGFL